MTPTSKRAIDIGPVEAAAIKTVGGKVRLRLLFTVEQIEALLAAARDNDDGDEESRNVTQSHAREEKRRKIDDADDAGARARATVVPPQQNWGVFVCEGTRAWDAWMRVKRVNGRYWNMTKVVVVNGERRTGWYFPTLFPPAATGPPPPPAEPETTMDAMADEFLAAEGKG